MSSVRTVRSMRSLPSLRKSLHSSSTAPKPSHLLSSQRDTVRTHYASLTVPILKQECKERGLKLGGKKMDLVNRIVGFEQAQTFSTSSKSQISTSLLESKMKNLSINKSAGKEKVLDEVRTPSIAAARAFSSSQTKESPEAVDTYTVPKPPHTKSSDHPVTKIPIGPDAEGKSTVFSDLSVKPVNADTGISAGEVHVVDSAVKVSKMNVDLGDAIPQHDDEFSGSSSSNQLKSSDKSFLTILGAAVVAWWASEYVDIFEDSGEERVKNSFKY